MYCLKYLMLLYMYISVPVSASELMDRAIDLVQAGLRPNTQKTYNSAQKQFLEFCSRYDRVCLPCDENTLLMYIAYLHNVKRLKGQTIKVYISAVRALHIMQACQYSFKAV
jgi:hypothetical protein